MSDCSIIARSAIARTHASFIASLIVVAPTSSAPRKMNGQHSTLLTWFGKSEQPVAHGGGDDRRRLVLGGVENGDRQTPAPLALDVEAVGHLDGLEVDAGERGREGANHVDDLVGIALAELDLEAVQAGELLGEH